MNIHPTYLQFRLWHFSKADRKLIDRLHTTHLILFDLHRFIVQT